MICAALILYAVIAYRSVVSNFQQEVDSDLESRAVRAQVFFANSGLTAQDLEIFASNYKSSTLPVPTPGNSLDPMATRTYDTGGDLASALTYIQLINGEGKVVQRTPDLKVMSKPETQAALHGLIQNQIIGSSDVRLANKERVRVYTVRLDRVENRGYVQVVRSMQEIDSILEGLLLPLAFVTSVSVIAVSFLGWWFARRIFAPLEKMTETAYRIGVNNDLAERVETNPSQNDEVTRLGRSLNLMLDRLEKSFKAQKQFIADSSHELRTPLTVIRGNIDLLRRNPDPQNQQDSLQAIERESARMQRLVQDLLLLAQTDAGQTLELAPLPLHEMVLEIFQETRVLALQRRQQLKLDKFDAVLVEGDADRLKRAILNLVDNAIKYTQEEGEVTMSLVRGKQWARVIITDNGPGIAAKDQERIFDRFYRVDKARSRASGGTGLGLPIVKYIVEAHNGRLTLQSEPGQGTTFTIWLKALPDDEEPDEDKLAEENEGDNSEAGTAKEKQEKQEKAEHISAGD